MVQVNPDKDNKAKGLIFFDNDGINTIENKEYIRIDLNYENNQLIINTTKKDGFIYDYQDNILGRIDLLGTNNKQNCNIIINFADGKIKNLTMDKDVENDKFYYIFKEEEIVINDINKIIFESN